MKNNLIDHPHPASAFHAGITFIQEFVFKKMVYLDPIGHWKENPENSIHWAVNEMLYQLWKMEEKKRKAVLNKIIEIFLKKTHWPIVLKMRKALMKNSLDSIKNLSTRKTTEGLASEFRSSKRPQKYHSFLIILHVLSWILRYEALRQNKEYFIPDWDLTEKKKLQKHQNSFLISDKILKNCLSREETQRFNQIFNEIKEFSPHDIGIIPDLIAEEQKLKNDINELLEQAQQETKKEESYDLIREKIFPPMGVVTETSPALLRPCIQLIKDKSIEVSSGIQYRASVILSILQDPRSTETLLHAIKTFPLYFTNIRKNIIYTLGELKENDAVKPLKKVLDGPDKMIPTHSDRTQKPSLLREQKEEALRSLGKIGLESLNILSSLVKYQHHSSPKIKIYLSWALGQIGKLQKEKRGGVSADILISLLPLLKTKNKQVFEESVNALREIDMPEFLHTLYLYDVGAISILGLKPAQRGLYELSETLHYLIHSQGRAIMAVNGDSGTGKTYFCESILESFGDLEPKEILYLMRDRKKDQKIFNQILGIQWLKKYIDPIYYQDYPHSEKDDHPEEFLTQFLEENSDKKLIIIDGCRDRYYFQRIIDLLYFHEQLNVVVNFRANFPPEERTLKSGKSP
ncbi:MAG: hypothetical protein ACOC5G_00470 [Acidobacteriota bacterium]